MALAAAAAATAAAYGGVVEGKRCCGCGFLSPPPALVVVEEPPLDDLDDIIERFACDDVENDPCRSLLLRRLLLFEATVAGRPNVIFSKSILAKKKKTEKRADVQGGTNDRRFYFDVEQNMILATLRGRSINLC